MALLSNLPRLTVLAAVIIVGQSDKYARDKTGLVLYTPLLNSGNIPDTILFSQFNSAASFTFMVGQPEFQ